MIGFVGTSFGFASESDSIDYFSDPNYKIFSVVEGIHEYRVPYKISGAELNIMDLDCDGTELIISIESAKDGTLIINIPRKMLDTRFNNSDDNFLVLLDGKEVDFKENYSDIESRTLEIPFFKDSQVLEIIITQLISQFPENEVSCGEEGSEESPYYHLLSPLKQFKLGIKMHDIMCQEGLQLVIKSSNEFPACVKPETKQKLIERGWAISDEKPLFVEISLDKFTSAQAVGYPIDDFTIKLEGYYSRPHAPDIQIINETGHVIWTNYDDIGHVILGRISPVEFCKEYQFNDIGGSLTFNKTGTYKFIFTFEEFSLEQEIKILQSTSSISLDKPNFHCK